jgi:hypothetical protein
MISFFHARDFSAPSSHDFTSQKKREGKLSCYFCFLVIQKPASTATATIIAANNIAISMVISGASAGSVSSGSEGSGAAALGIQEFSCSHAT